MSRNEHHSRDIFESLQQAAYRYPEKEALICGGHRLTYRELVTAVERAVAALDANYPNVNRIALHFKNCFELVVLAIAGAALGKTLIPLNPSLRKPQLLKQVTTTRANLVISTQSGKKMWRDLAPELPATSYVELLNTAGNAPVKKQPINPEHPYIITLSSGSTGTPKPIVLSQACKIRRSKQAANCYHITHNDIILCASPFYHSLGQRLVFLPLLHGATLVLLEHFTDTAWINAVSNEQVTFTIAVSSHLSALKNTLLSPENGLGSLRCLVSSSALLDNTLKRKLNAQLGCAFHEMYGATEVATATNLSPEQAEHKPDSVGFPLPGVKLEILDTGFSACPPLTVGEIAIQSPVAFLGYEPEPSLTQKCHYKEYFLSGDLGYCDEDGYLYFVSRKKDLIITGGINVVPADIEAELLTIRGIKECCVIGVADEYLGEAILAVCVADPDVNADPNYVLQLRMTLNERLAGFQQPRDYVFTNALPLTSTGKLDKELLRKTYGDYFAKAVNHG